MAEAARRRADRARGRADTRAARRRARRPGRSRRTRGRRLRLLVLAAPVVPRRSRATASAPELWAAAAVDGERWLRECPPPFWGLAGRRRPDGHEQFRQTEATVAAVGGIRPKSTFQIGGAGSVGTGSVRGFPALTRLRAGGFTIWPFDAPATRAGGGRDLSACAHGRGGEARRRCRGSRTSTRTSPASRRATASERSRARTRSTPRCRRW